MANQIDIVSLRKTLGFKQREVAEKIGIKQGYLSELETGKKPIPVSIYNSFVDAYGQDVCDTFTIEEGKESGTNIKNVKIASGGTLQNNSNNGTNGIDGNCLKEIFDEFELQKKDIHKEISSVSKEVSELKEIYEARLKDQASMISKKDNQIDEYIQTNKQQFDRFMSMLTDKDNEIKKLNEDNRLLLRLLSQNGITPP